MKNLLWPVDMDRKNLFFNFFVTISLITLSSCTVIDIDYHMPMTKFETSESTGNHLFEKSNVTGSVKAGLGSSHKITLAEVVDPIIFSETVNDDSTIDPRVHLGAAASLGLIPRLDITFNMAIDSPSNFGIKFQFLGATESEAKKGWSGAIIGKVGGGEEDEGNISTSNNAGTELRKYNAVLDFTTYEGNLAFGYRFDQHTLVYLNSFYTYYEVEGTLSSSAFSPVTVKGTSRQYGSLLGVKYTASTGFFTMLEGGVVRARWEKQNDDTNGAYGFTLGINF